MQTNSFLGSWWEKKIVLVNNREFLCYVLFSIEKITQRLHTLMPKSFLFSFAVLFCMNTRYIQIYMFTILIRFISIGEIYAIRFSIFLANSSFQDFFFEIANWTFINWIDLCKLTLCTQAAEKFTYAWWKGLVLFKSFSNGCKCI